MQNKRRIIGIVAAVLLALVGTVSLVAYVNSAKDNAVADEALVDVYVVDDFVPKGAASETIAASVSIEQVPARLKQSGAITDLAALGDEVAATDLQPGDQLLEARLAAKEAVVEEVSDKVQVSALLEAERAVGGAIKQGDLVGVYVSFDPFDVEVSGPQESGAADDAAIQAAAGQVEQSTESDTGDAETTGPTKTPNVTKLEFQQVLVTNVQTINAPVSNNNGDDENDGPDIEQVTGTQYVVTLALSPEQSERFVFATEFGKVWLSIQPATVADDGTRVVTLGSVYAVVR
ncbi:MAG TPA: RcpC/CpaB family pilus assembly protein [Ilumatobacteraceae bacterium]|nr:RcpC/CpaB family pilus assembly protein [Ilumatobacteraceae bacterium]